MCLWSPWEPHWLKSTFFNLHSLFWLDSVGELTALSADKICVIFGDLTRFSYLLDCIESIMDNLGHFASVNTNTVQVFCTEAEKIALLVTVQC